MLRKINLKLFCLLFLFPQIVFAEELSKTDLDYFNNAIELEKSGDEEEASKIYTELLKSNDKSVSLSSALILAQKIVKQERFSDAVKYYQWILQQDPQLTQARFELALCYMKLGYWSSADYQLRLALSSKNLTSEAKSLMEYYRFLIRQNKNWNFWFNIGAAPDNNINNATGGEQCVNYLGMVLCNQLAEKEKAVGFNVSFGGSYENKLSDNWRLRHEAMIWSSTYDKKEYDDLYLTYTMGPKYIWGRGEVFIGPSVYRRWLNHQPYSSALGLKVNSNFDITNSVAFGLELSYMPTKYDDYSDVLDGYVKGINSRVSYSFDASKYFILKTGIEEESTKDVLNSNIKVNYALGFGVELPYGFSMYLEPSVLKTKYKYPRTFVKNYALEDIKEDDTTKKFLFSITNKRFSMFGLIPTFAYVYTNKESNVWQKQYKKSTFELTVNKSF